MGPFYIKIAEYLKNVPDLVVGLMDASANELEGTEIPFTELPVIIFYPKGGNEDDI